MEEIIESKERMQKENKILSDIEWWCVQKAYPSIIPVSAKCNIFWYILTASLPVSLSHRHVQAIQLVVGVGAQNCCRHTACRLPIQMFRCLCITWSRRTHWLSLCNCGVRQGSLNKNLSVRTHVHMFAYITVYVCVRVEFSSFDIASNTHTLLAKSVITRGSVGLMQNGWFYPKKGT